MSHKTRQKDIERNFREAGVWQVGKGDNRVQSKENALYCMEWSNLEFNQ